MKRLRFSILATVLGNTLEWYDLALYGLLAPLFATLFFPASSDFSFFSHPFIFLAIGGVARPLGALFFGVIGDRYGRKTAMIASIVLMVLPVLLIGGLPTYAQIGFTATILLALVPFIQGFCAGGEFSGSIVFLSETAPPKLRGATSSWAVFGFLIGMLLGAIDIYLLENHLSPEQFEAWGWRIPFLFGGFLALFAFFLRRMLHETPVFLHAQERGETAKSPIIEALKQHKKQVLQACGISFLDAVAFNTIVIFSTSYFIKFAGIQLHQAVLINTLTIFLMALSIPFFGRLITAWGNIKIAKTGAVCLFVFSTPLYLFFFQNSLALLITAQFMLALFLALYLSSIPAILSSCFPTKVRYTCTGLSYSLTIALFGGTAPLLNSYAIHFFDHPLIPCAYLMLAAVISFLTLRTLPPQPQ